MDRVSSRERGASTAKPTSNGPSPLVQKSDFKGMDFAAGEALLKPRDGAHGKHAAGATGGKAVQRAVYIQDTKTDHTKRYAKSTIELKKTLREQYGAENWKRGWVGYLDGLITSDQIAPFASLDHLAKHLLEKFPARDDKAVSVEATAFRKAHDESGLSLVGFLWKACSAGVPLKDGTTFGKANVLSAMSTKAGREYVDARWRDSSGAMKAGQVVQGQHEWLLTSDLVYVLEHAKTEADLVLWYTAAEILRTPTKNVVFEFQLTDQQLELLKSGKATVAELGVVSAHAGGLFQPRDADDDKRANPKTANVQVAAHSPAFHKDLSAMLHNHLSDSKNEFEGFLTALTAAQGSQVWNGALANSSGAATAAVGFTTAAAQNAPNVAGTLAEWQQLQAERYARDMHINRNRTAALLSEIDRLKQTSTKMAVDTTQLALLKDDVRAQVEARFKALDAEFDQVAKQMKVHFQALRAKAGSQSEVTAVLQQWRSQWDATYADYINAKAQVLAKARS